MCLKKTKNNLLRRSSVVCLLLFFLCGCPLDEKAILLLGGEVVVPEFLGVGAISKKEVKLEFSCPVSLCDVSSDESLGSTTVLSHGNDVFVTFSNETQVGKSYRLRGAVADFSTSLSFEVEFTGFNDNVPELFISEFRTEYSKPKVEFIELQALTSGNLSGVTLLTASAGKNGVYTFPSVNVEAGDFIVLHLRNTSQEIDDIATKTSGSSGADSSENAWDFWKNTTEKTIKKSDVIILEQSPNGKILDGVVFSEGSQSSWKEEILPYVERLVDAEIWSPDSLVESAVQTTSPEKKNYVTATRTANLDIDCASSYPRSKDFWYISASSCATPGNLNSTKRY